MLTNELQHKNTSECTIRIKKEANMKKVIITSLALLAVVGVVYAYFQREA